jgi:hypothetical protein
MRRGCLDEGARVKVGRAIDVGEVLSRSLRILSTRPLIMLPQLIALIPTLILNASSSLSPLRVIVSIVSFVLSLIASGAYPSLVKTVIEGGQPSVTEALGKAYHRFWTLLPASILVALIVVLGAIALVVPGIIFATWYAYTIPAIMLEEKGALQGMAASKAFGRDKKLSTFIIFVTVVLVVLVLSGVQSLLSLASPLLGHFVYAILLVPLGAWVSVILAYTYLTCGPSPASTMTAGAAYGMAPPVSPQPPAESSASVGASGTFCRFCGSPVRAGSKFCASCGKPT